MKKEEKRILKKFQQFIFKEKLFKKGDKILVGCSGGADSTCLVLLLKQLEKKYQIKIHLVHINYQLREKDSLLDEEFVRELASKEKLGLTVVKYPLSLKRKALKGSKFSEKELRDFRYQIFEKIRKAKKFDYVAVAHNKNDWGETILMNILRGSGLAGICSLKPKRGNIIRPLLFLKRTEIESYLKKQKQPFRIDQSNFDQSYLRNKIRHQLIPFFEENFSPLVLERLCAIGENFWGIESFLESFLKELRKKIVSKKASDFWELNLNELTKLKKNERKLFWYSFLKEEKLLKEGKGKRLIEEIEKIIESKKSKVKIIQTKQLTIIKKTANLLIRKET